jgi:hypothetical protein
MSKGDSLGGSNSLLYHGPSFTIENLPSPFARSLASFKLESLIAPTIGIERELTLAPSYVTHSAPSPMRFVITGVGTTL